MARLVCLVLLCALVGTQALPQRFAEVPDDQIVGGHDADIADYPWQVSFRKYGSHICGGSILNKYWILTAAHCAQAVYAASSVTIKVGASTLTSGGAIYQAVSVTAHPKYDSSKMENDVGLVKLSSAISFNSNVKPVVIAKSEPSSSDPLTVSGWGVLYSGGYSLPETLQAVSVPTVTRESCNKAYSRYGYAITSSMLCAGSSGKDSCQGDSGGPLVNSKNQQVGVVSWGIGCASPGIPGVYSNLINSVVRAWIKKQTGV